MIATESSQIVLVEDNQDDIDLTLRALRTYGLTDQVLLAKDGSEVLELLALTDDPSVRPTATPRLILLDINLPKLSGLEVLKRLRAAEHTRLVPVVMLTTSSDHRDVTTSYALGANSYIQKPVSFAKFTSAIEELTTYWLSLNQTHI